MTKKETGNIISQDPRVLGFEPDEFQHLIDSADITENQKREFLETLWNIVVTFVDLGFGIDATQQAMREMVEIPADDKSHNTQPGTKRLIAASFETVSSVQPEKEISEEEELYEIQ